MSSWLGWGWGSDQGHRSNTAGGAPSSAGATAASSGDSRWHTGSAGPSTSGIAPNEDGAAPAFSVGGGGGARERSLWNVLGGGSHLHPSNANSSNAGEQSSALWGNDESLGVTKREVSLMSQLAIPPPLRHMMSQRGSAANNSLAPHGAGHPFVPHGASFKYAPHSHPNSGAAPLLPADLNALLLSSQTSSMQNLASDGDSGVAPGTVHPAFVSAFRGSLSGAQRFGGGGSSAVSSAAVTPTAAAAAAAAAALGAARLAAASTDDRSWQAKLLVGVA